PPFSVSVPRRAEPPAAVGVGPQSRGTPGDWVASSNLTVEGVWRGEGHGPLTSPFFSYGEGDRPRQARLLVATGRALEIDRGRTGRVEYGEKKGRKNGGEGGQPRIHEAGVVHRRRPCQRPPAV